jgi:hypothetical protein
MKKVPEPKVRYTFMIRPSLMKAIRDDADKVDVSYSRWMEAAALRMLPALIRSRLQKGIR